MVVAGTDRCPPIFSASFVRKKPFRFTTVPASTGSGIKNCSTTGRHRRPGLLSFKPDKAFTLRRTSKRSGTPGDASRCA